MEETEKIKKIIEERHQLISGSSWMIDLRIH
jgi:hypothetical protein